MTKQIDMITNISEGEYKLKDLITDKKLLQDDSIVKVKIREE